MPAINTALETYVLRTQADYQQLAAFIRAHAPFDEAAQVAADAALNEYRVLLGKLVWLLVTMEAKRE